VKAKKAQSGFTLVEMALVLVVIGLILGAVSIGKDMQRNAEYKKLKQKFVDQWVQAYNQYYDRTGHVLGDIEGTPMMMVNGKVDHSAGDDPTTVTTAGTALCGESSTASGDSLQDLLAASGITPPPGRGTGAEDAYLYLDTNGNPQQLSVCFQWLPPAANGPGNGNVMRISGLTPDLARFLDSSIDGQVAGTTGRFRYAKTTTSGTTTTVSAAAWPAGNDVAADGTTAVSDTEQVTVVQAVLRMNQ